MTIRAFNIEWDTDGEEVDLPTEVVLDVDSFEEDDDEDQRAECVADALSDQFGWCVLGFRWEVATGEIE